VVKDVVKIIMKDNIYPSKDDLRAATEAYLNETYPEFYSKFVEYYRWVTYYNEHFYNHVSFFLRIFINLFLN